MDSQIVVGVPGPWRGPEELARALEEAHGAAYVSGGRSLMETATGERCQVQWRGHDPHLRELFEIGGQGTFPPELLDAVEGHRSIVHLFFRNTGYGTACAAARFAGALLAAGGVGVKVESAGTMHAPERWRAQAQSDHPADIYSLYVSMIAGEDLLFTCGMHNFGLEDAAVPAPYGEEDADQLNTFNLYRLTEEPDLSPGETFGAEPDGRRYRLDHGPYLDGYEPDTLLHNPHGLWWLHPAGTSRAADPRLRSYEA